MGTMQSESNEWIQEEWLHSARKLVHWVSQTPSDSRVMLLVRHSHRQPIEDHIVQLSTELTPLGCRMSMEMGRRLPLDRKFWFYFSFVTRCYQTASEMSKGVIKTGGKVEDLDALDVLAAPEVNDDRFWTALQPDGKNITDFVNMWGNGDFGEMVEPFEEYKDRLFRDTIERLRHSQEGTMHVHITHDLALMAAKRILLEREVDIPDREPFLGGIGIVLDKNGLNLYSSDETFKLSLF